MTTNLTHDGAEEDRRRTEAEDADEQELIMGVMVVFESMYGNTWQIAEAIAEGAGSALRDGAGSSAGGVEVVEVGQAPRTVPPDVELLVVGAPTHALGLSRASTRSSAAEQAGHEVISAGDGVREWLAVLEAPTELRAAAFDTHTDERWVPGSAAVAVRRRLRGLGCKATSPAVSFYVGGIEGPLLPGELDRARAWGASLVQQRPGAPS